MSYKIIKNHTLKEYNYKYGTKHLSKVSKTDADKNISLLNDKTWWLIDNTYYEVPSNKGFKGWWSNLNKGAQIAICCLVGAAVVTAVTVPTVIAIKNKTVSKTADVTGNGKDIIKQTTFTKQSDGTYKAKLEVAEGKSKDDIGKIEIKVGNKVLVKNTDYTISDSFEIIIKAGVISNDNDNITIEVTKVVFYTINVNAETGGSVKGGGSFKEGTSVTITATPDTNYSFDGWYENDTKVIGAEATYTFTITKDRTLKAKFKVEKLSPVDFSSCSWDDVAIRCNKLENGEITENEFYDLFTFDGNAVSSKEDFIGKERTVKINGQDHRVRVIDVLHGKDETESSGKDLIVENDVVTNKIASLTFEFANLISDSEGNSLAYQWNDTNNIDTANYDYINSTIRYALTGEGNNGGKDNNTILVAQKEQTTWSSTYNKTILSMIPEDLKNNLKTIKKSVGTTNSYSETSYNDKLFMTSAAEIGYTSSNDKGYGIKYKYYTDHTEKKDKYKCQVNDSTIYFPTTDKISRIPTTAEQAYKTYPVDNFAGVNCNTKSNNKVGYYWLRSPCPIDSGLAWYVFTDSYSQGDYGSAFARAYGIAPAFCI